MDEKVTQFGAKLERQIKGAQKRKRERTKEQQVPKELRGRFAGLLFTVRRRSRELLILGGGFNAHT
eukprot:1994920-Rhodomonas_salina.1